MSSDQHRSRSHASQRGCHDGVYPPSSASSSDHSDGETTSHHSSSRRVLAHVLAPKEPQRTTDAERRATGCLVRAQASIDAGAQADADAIVAHTELAMYRMHLERAQSEISRAQELLDGLEARRHDAEQDAARSPSVAREHSEQSISAPREEGRQQGWNEGFRQGILRGRREAESELKSRRLEEEEDDQRSQSRPRPLGDARFTQVTPISSTSEPSSDDIYPRGVSECVNLPPLIYFFHFILNIFSSRRTPEIGPIALLPSVPVTFRRSSPEQPNQSNAARRHHNRIPDGQPYGSPELTSSPPQSRSRSSPPEPAHSRPCMPHDDSPPSTVQPTPIPASETIPLVSSPSASPVRHPSVRIPTATAEDTSVFSSPSPSLDSFMSNLTHSWWPHSGVLNLAGQGLSYSSGISQESWDDGPNHVSQPCIPGPGFDNIPPGLDITASTTEVIDIRPGQGQHGTFYWDSLVQRALPKRQTYERPAAQILGQGRSDRRFTCPYDNCGKNFSGEWEKMRHIKTIHCPPTIGCRDCNYKQSRKDLFSEHCKKRHPGRSIDDLMIQLDTRSE